MVIITVIKNHPAVKIVHKYLILFCHMLVYYSLCQNTNGPLFIAMFSIYWMEKYRKKYDLNPSKNPQMNE